MKHQHFSFAHRFLLVDTRGLEVPERFAVTRMAAMLAIDLRQLQKSWWREGRFMSGWL